MVYQEWTQEDYDGLLAQVVRLLMRRHKLVVYLLETLCQGAPTGQRLSILFLGPGYLIAFTEDVMKKAMQTFLTDQSLCEMLDRWSRMSLYTGNIDVPQLDGTGVVARVSLATAYPLTKKVVVSHTANDGFTQRAPGEPFRRPVAPASAGERLSPKEMCLLGLTELTAKYNIVDVLTSHRTRCRTCKVTILESKKRCPGCRVLYCDIECRRKDWRVHRRTCADIRDALERLYSVYNLDNIEYIVEGCLAV